MICPPEYIIEEHDDGHWCIIYDPPSGGEYSSFKIRYNEPTWLVNTRIREHLNGAEDFLQGVYNGN